MLWLGCSVQVAPYRTITRLITALHRLPSLAAQVVLAALGIMFTSRTYGAVALRATVATIKNTDTCAKPVKYIERYYLPFLTEKNIR